MARLLDWLIWLLIVGGATAMAWTVISCVLGTPVSQAVVVVEPQVEPDGLGATPIFDGPSEEFRSGPEGYDLGGVSHVCSRTKIFWKSAAMPESSGTTPIEVLKAVRSRLSYLQRSPHASDVQARALWEVNKAIDTLEGQEDLTSSILGGSK